ncbi:MAG TPA: IclR family transcriptional regulator [Gaiella sp.]|jgi:DNA-binding IclR family transcriptional regulator|nr:IclR family transcriptional regulator [Gaiella sp.]
MATRNSSLGSASRPKRELENRSASRVLDVLDLFLADGSCYTLTDVSDRLRIPKSTAHGILHAMRRHGYLTLDRATNGYTISLGFVGRTRATPAVEVLRQLARRHLIRLASTLGETAKLIGYEGSNSVAIDFVDGAGPLKYAVTLGQRWPLHATGGGKLYLAQYDDDTVRAMFADGGLEQITPGTIVDVDALAAEVAEARRNGWARQREEIHEGISGFAAPVHDAGGRLLAAMIVMGPTARIDDNADAIVSLLVSEARALSVEIEAPQLAGTQTEAT